MKKFKRLQTEIKSVNGEKRSLTAVVSTAGIDRHGERILHSAWKLAEFRENPIIIVDHEHKAQNVVGKASRVEIVDEKLEMDITFSDDTVLAKDIFNLFKNGFLNAFSVGFLPKKSDWVEEKDSDGNKRSVFTIKEAELMEVSAVAIPANTEALTKAVKQGIACEKSATEIRESLGKEFELEEKKAELEKMIKIFTENHEVVKSYRRLLDQMCKRCGIEPTDNESERVSSLLSALKTIVPEESSEPNLDVKTSLKPEEVETPPKKVISKNELEKII